MAKLRSTGFMPLAGREKQCQAHRESTVPWHRRGRRPPLSQQILRGDPARPQKWGKADAHPPAPVSGLFVSNPWVVPEASGLILGTIFRDNHIGGGDSIFPERMEAGYIRGSRPHTKCQVVREPCQRPGREGTSAAERGSWEMRQHRDANGDKCYGEPLLVITDIIQWITCVHIHMCAIAHACMIFVAWTVHIPYRHPGQVWKPSLRRTLQPAAQGGHFTPTSCPSLVF